MTKWIRFDYKDDVGLFGILDSDFVEEHEGNIFENTFWEKQYTYYYLSFLRIRFSL